MCWCWDEVGQVAQQMGRFPSTISRELGRNRTSRGVYSAQVANKLARARRYTKPTGIVLKNAHIRAYVVGGLRARWSPEQIAGRLPIDYPGMTISHESIYLYVYEQARKKNTELYRCLPSKRRKRTHWYRTRSRDSILGAGKTSIADRPDEVNDRRTFGHWEVDLIIGRRNASAICVILERTSRCVVLGVLIDKTAARMYHALVTTLGALPRALRTSMTVDNGSENACHRDLTALLGIAVYFCDPYKSWQKGAVENMNGLIRRCFPRGTDFSSIDRRDVIALQQALNNRPRKCLGYRTPYEVFSEVLAAYSK